MLNFSESGHPVFRGSKCFGTRRFEKAQEKDICLYTSVATTKLLKWFFARSSPSISSVSTEKWRTCATSWLAEYLIWEFVAQDNPLCWSAPLESCFPVFSFLDRVFFEACALVRSQPFHVLGSGAAQLSSLATLEAAVAHGVQALLEAPPEPVVWIPATGLVPRLAHLRPRSRSRSPLPKTVPSRPRGSTLLNQGAPRVFPSRALLWPSLIARSPLAATPAPRPLPTALLSH